MSSLIRYKFTSYNISISYDIFNDKEYLIFIINALPTNFNVIEIIAYIQNINYKKILNSKAYNLSKELKELYLNIIDYFIVNNKPIIRECKKHMLYKI